MSEELKALREMYQVCLVANVADMRPEFELIETTLKALEIIKEKNVDILRIKITQSVERYNEYKIKGCRNLTQEEYDLLKEVLS